MLKKLKALRKRLEGLAKGGTVAWRRYASGHRAQALAGPGQLHDIEVLGVPAVLAVWCGPPMGDSSPATGARRQSERSSCRELDHP